MNLYKEIPIKYYCPYCNYRNVVMYFILDDCPELEPPKQKEPSILHTCKHWDDSNKPINIDDQMLFEDHIGDQPMYKVETWVNPTKE